MAKSETDQLVEEIERARLSLASTVDQLVDRTNPKNVARRTLANVKGKFVTEDGQPKMEAIMPVALGALGIVGALIVLRRIVR